jgi:hypothetical protein
MNNDFGAAAATNLFWLAIILTTAVFFVSTLDAITAGITNASATKAGN